MYNTTEIGNVDLKFAVLNIHVLCTRLTDTPE